MTDRNNWGRRIDACDDRVLRGDRRMNDKPLEIHLARSGLTLTAPADKSILEALQAAGVYVATSCETGVCGTCLTPVLEGAPDHRDDYQMDEEKAANTHIAVCVSRAHSDRLVLDL